MRTPRQGRDRSPNIWMSPCTLPGEKILKTITNYTFYINAASPNYHTMTAPLLAGLAAIAPE
ncbi:hypothetical protein [Coleofasciculus sp.]|uniref:hypothetical protein n=1 Tax=Coleofasciculus sp. TaxID=3100458 RepID=UPI003A3C31B3